MSQVYGGGFGMKNGVKFPFPGDYREGSMVIWWLSEDELGEGLLNEIAQQVESFLFC